jgi:hypothetical protein
MNLEMHRAFACETPAISPKFIIRECKQTNLPTLTLIMAPATRRGRYQTPPPGPLKGADATTTRKSR